MSTSSPLKRPTWLLLLAIFVEGYAVLAGELLAIRQTTPHVGNGIDTVSIIISAVLLPLAVGYNRGGRAYSEARTKGSSLSIRRRLVRNLLWTALIMIFGLSYMVLDVFFFTLTAIGLENRILQTALYSVLFLIWPFYLLGQTIPLVSNYFSKSSLSAATGRMLFFSTTGSFLGSVFSTLVLMAFAGVGNTLIITIALLLTLAVMLGNRKRGRRLGDVLVLFTLCVLLNNTATLRAVFVVEDNAYNTVSILTKEKDGNEKREMIINNSLASHYTPATGAIAAYTEYVNGHILKHLPKDRVGEILVLGAGGFTIGLEDTRNNYTFVDIDSALLEVTEEHFIKQKLTPNKKLEAVDARAFLRTAPVKYDFVLVDVYTNRNSIPMHLITQEFYQELRSVLKPDGVIAANFIISPTLADKFSQSVDNTFRSVFPYVNRRVIQDFDPWEIKPKTKNANVLYIAYGRPEHGGFYTDDKNRYFLDH